MRPVLPALVASLAAACVAAGDPASALTLIFRAELFVNVEGSDEAFLEVRAFDFHDAGELSQLDIGDLHGWPP